MTAGCDYCSHTGVQADGETPCPCQEIPIAKAELAAVERRLDALEAQIVWTMAAFSILWGSGIGILAHTIWRAVW